jgi:hypothetical protein
MNTISTLSPSIKSHINIDEISVLKSYGFLMKPFDELVIHFCDQLSKKLLSNRQINTYAEIAALGFWIRRNNILQLKESNKHLFNNNTYVTGPIGIVFHICPANVDTMFMYSLVVSLLMGNKNILRISNKMDSAHMYQLFDTINELLNHDQYEHLQSYISIIKYDHDAGINTFLSKKANARVIWGGDNTIKTFKAFETSARTKDIVFADRVSMLCINIEAYLELDGSDLDSFLKNFFNDAYTFDQMGCSSPQTIYFVGDNVNLELCKGKFLKETSQYVKGKYITDIISLASLKLNRLVDDTLDNVLYEFDGDNYLTLVKLSENADSTILHGCGGGYFYYKQVQSVSNLSDLTYKKVQTISYFGFTNEDKNSLLEIANGEGIDRIVPIGQALHFNYIWDGYNLFDELSKKVYIK